MRRDAACRQPPGSRRTAADWSSERSRDGHLAVRAWSDGDSGGSYASYRVKRTPLPPEDRLHITHSDSVATLLTKYC